MDGAAGAEAHPMPGWVKLLIVLGVAVGLLVVALHLTGNFPGGHAP